jgi:hypothetical protein
VTGCRAFVGDDISITLAAVMMKEPDWRARPAPTPWSLRRLLTRCLKKDPKAVPGARRTDHAGAVHGRWRGVSG